MNFDGAMSKRRCFDRAVLFYCADERVLARARRLGTARQTTVVGGGAAVEAFELAVAAPRSGPRGHLAAGRSILGPRPGRPARDAAAADYTQASLGATDAVVVKCKAGILNAS